METSEKRPIAEVELADLKRELDSLQGAWRELRREHGKTVEELEESRAHADALADRLQSAVDRINDMLEGDDGQAWKEAEKALPLLKEALTAYRNREE